MARSRAAENGESYGISYNATAFADKGLPDARAVGQGRVTQDAFLAAKALTEGEARRGSASCTRPGTRELDLLRGRQGPRG
jgi:hypothetical protein